MGTNSYSSPTFFYLLALSSPSSSSSPSPCLLAPVFRVAIKLDPLPLAASETLSDCRPPNINFIKIYRPAAISHLSDRTIFLKNLRPCSRTLKFFKISPIKVRHIGVVWNTWTGGSGGKSSNAETFAAKRKNRLWSTGGGGKNKGRLHQENKIFIKILNKKKKNLPLEKKSPTSHRKLLHLMSGCSASFSTPCGYFFLPVYSFIPPPVSSSSPLFFPPVPILLIFKFRPRLRFYFENKNKKNWPTGRRPFSSVWCFDSEDSRIHFVLQSRLPHLLSHAWSTFACNVYLITRIPAFITKWMQRPQDNRFNFKRRL